MKRIISLVLVVLFLAVPFVAIGQDGSASTSIIIGTTDVARALDMSYTVKTDDVVSVDVTFRDDLELPSYYYTNGTLNISIASAYPIDMSIPLAQVTATLANGAKVAPELELKELLVNGKERTNKPSVESLEAEIEDDIMQISLKTGGFAEKNCKALAVGYSEQGKMMTVDIFDIPASSGKSEVELSLENVYECSKVRIFILDDGNCPMINSLMLSVPSV